MAETRLADIIEPKVFTPYMYSKTKELSAFFQSGVMVTSKELDAKAKSGGNTVTMPSFKDLSNTESRIGSDDPSDKATHEKIESFADQAIVHRRNQSWSGMDLSVDVAGADPMGNIADRVARYWNRDHQRTLVASLRGVLAANIANNGADMVYSLYDDVAAPGDATLISGPAVIRAAQTLGDAKNDLAAIAMHSVVHARLQEQNLIQFTETSDGKIGFETYLGYRVIVDDGLPVVAGANSPKYVTILFGKGAVGYGEGAMKTPTEVDRIPEAGNGQGQEVLYSRRNFVIHPMGIKYTGASQAGVSPTNTELALGGNWTRVRPERKQVPIVFLETNG
ncbi:major capsid protein [Aestuariispira insulae]|uniref:Coat protein n=1 Tax=Aestuariispira insulae TaxID=1461337 RepID=A0A3D9HS71_9PROT|nr:major capsid protein [Aestuariispira insulae]RED52181.1 hypothetical protein DFP90_102199 [Aestuariispira insulae]